MPNDTERVLALMSLEQASALENFEVTGIQNGTYPALMFDGLDSMLQPRRIYYQAQMPFEAPMFAHTVRHIANIQGIRLAQRPHGLLFCPILLNSIKLRDTCPEDFLIGIDKHNKHRMVSNEARSGTYYTSEDQSHSWMLRFGDTDGLSWIRISDQLDPTDPRAHWIQDELKLFGIILPASILASIEGMKGDPITRIVEHPALEDILIRDVSFEDTKTGPGHDIIIRPDLDSYLAAHQRIKVVDIYA